MINKISDSVLKRIKCFPRSVWHTVDKLLVIGAHEKTNGGTAVVRIGGIGDMILSIPLLCNIKVTNGPVTLICSSKHRYMEEIFPYCADYFIFYDDSKFRKNIFYRRKFLRNIAEKGFYQIIQSGISRQQGGADVICWAARAKKTVGFYQRPWHTCEKNISNSWFDTLIDGKYGQKHELDRLSMLDSSCPDYELCLTALQAKKYAVDAINGYAVISVGASTSVREWDIGNFIEVAREIQKIGLLPVFVGTEKDKVGLDKYHVDFNHKNLVGKLTTKEYVELLKNSEIIICNESSPMHIGVIFGRYTIAIVSGGEFNNYCNYPKHLSKNLLVIHAQDTHCFNCGWRCIYKNNDDKPFPCLEKIDSHRVIKEIFLYMDFTDMSVNNKI
ncbi:MAG: glycosyltransferase family 9 protein [Thermoplasmata archaeon]